MKGPEISKASVNMSNRSPQIVSTKQQRKTVVRWMIEEVGRCGSEKKYHQKQFKIFLQFLDRTMYGRKDAVCRNRTDGTQADKIFYTQCKKIKTRHLQ